MYSGCWPVRDVIHSHLKNTSRSYRRKQLLLDAEAQISVLEEEALELGRYIKGKGKAVGSGVKTVASGNGKEPTVSGSSTGGKVIGTRKKSKR